MCYIYIYISILILYTSSDLLRNRNQPTRRATPLSDSQSGLLIVSMIDAPLRIQDIDLTDFYALLPAYLVTTWSQFVVLGCYFLWTRFYMKIYTVETITWIKIVKLFHLFSNHSRSDIIELSKFHTRELLNRQFKFAISHNVENQKHTMFLRLTCSFYSSTKHNIAFHPNMINTLNTILILQYDQIHIRLHAWIKTRSNNSGVTWTQYKRTIRTKQTYI